MKNIEAFDQTAWSALEIGFPVDELEPMKRFYSEGLGFKPAGHVDLPSACIEGFRFGNCLLKLTLFLDAERRPKPRKPDPLSSYITLRVSALDQTVSRCQAIGAPLLVPVTSFKLKDLRTIRFAFFSDPMGNRIELVEGNAWSD
jgi:predicted enzyme related to lactoylglutathione lyase